MQNFKIIGKDDLLSVATQMKYDHYRLAQISCTKKDKLDLVYSFVKDYDLENIRIELEFDEEIESISGIYSYAFLYENEIKELFGVKIMRISLDFNGTFYKIKKTESKNGEVAQNG
ncbi:MAG: NADH-quinone oxidoreductase subunit C [Bacillota bacterium]|nr:NADH-quinone oxidoreductase subunit C [Bacillota bacterium]